jgi:CheY-like chemotaxis protein
VIVRRLDRKSKGPSETPPMPKRRSFPGTRVMVAEDNSVNQKVIQVMLRNLGCEAELFSNGRLAVNGWAQNDYDLIVLDCFMPEMDGISAAREIRRQELAKGRKRTNAFEQQRQECLAAGMDEFLTKPVAIAALEEVIGRLIPASATLGKAD